jgi:hypothetical protein
MAFSISPIVDVNEIDATGGVPAVATTEAAIAGAFRWGPVEDPVLISSEQKLVERFGEPDNTNFETFFSAASFLAYGNALWVCRAADANAYNAYANTSAVGSNFNIKNDDDYQTETTTGTGAIFVAKYPGALGNSLKVSICDSANAYTSVVGATAADANNSIQFEYVVGSNSATIRVTNSEGAAGNTAANTEVASILSALTVGDKLKANTQIIRITALGAPTIVSSGVVTATISLENRYTGAANLTITTGQTRYWEFYNVIALAPGTSTFTAARGGTGDELHVVVVDEDGEFTGTKNQILRSYANLSRATDAIGIDGGSIYYKTIINEQDPYIWWADDNGNAESNTAANISSGDNSNKPTTKSFVGGASGGGEANVAIAYLAAAADRFKNAEEIDISIMIAGKARGGTNGEQFANYLIDNIVDNRKDCVVTISPDKDDVVNVTDRAEKVVTFRQSCRYSSYAFFDSGYKQMYDKYNDVFRWVPLCGDTAGLMVRADLDFDAWFSPAGYNRGRLKNVIKLAFNPDKSERDLIFRNDVNPVVNFPDSGPMLFGDRTGLGKQSAFGEIGIRRMFIVLEKAISTMAKFNLFEFNDEFTRANFRNAVEPFLRDVQGRRGINDFLVVCDTTNNDGDVIDRNEFIGDIFIKPNHSIRYIKLNFVAVRNGVEFSEIVGTV